MNEVVVGIDGLDWYQPAKVEPESWLMPAPLAYVAPVRQAFSSRVTSSWRVSSPAVSQIWPS